jgi:hypothetical protein
MSRYAPVLWLALWPQIVVALPGVEQPVEGFARLVWASNEGEYGSNRGTQVASSWEYAQDGTQAVVWESAPVPQGYTRGFVTFAWSLRPRTSGGGARALPERREDTVVQLGLDGQTHELGRGGLRAPL